ncbi:hypothetical protein H7J07_05305 [Mycobacterium koreense]|uniref:hypothetical protein n=1 Tax=Mycolicibacillus koreensis TaxID=1069220 RepID=UPI0013D29F0D|nr:hypothetical protein [Mycolicibacillus koreensis]MCV7247641.1 hypothetical protein [Mycolicibacillus koreensis]
MQKLDKDSGGVLIDMDTGTVIGTNVRYAPLFTTSEPDLTDEDIACWAEQHGKAVFVD